MGKIVAETECAELTLVRPGQGPQVFTLSVGATLGELLREAGVAIRSPNVMIDGHAIEDAMVLKSRMVITLLPEFPRTPSKDAWRNTVGMFADDPDFEQMVEAGRAIREADRKATLEAMDREAAGREES